MGVYSQLTVICLSLMLLPLQAYTDFYPRHTQRQEDFRPLEVTSIRNRHSEIRNNTSAMISTSRPPPPVTLKSRRDNDGVITFPADKKADCIHTLCTNAIEYPAEKIMKFLSRSEFINSYFNVTDGTVNVEFGNRFKDDEDSLCGSRLQTMYPTTGTNTKKINKTIVNLDKYKQGVVSETCSGKECKYSESFPPSVKPYCKQKFINVKLLVFEEDEQLIFDMFEIPSCCVCVIKKNN